MKVWKVISISLLVGLVLYLGSGFVKSVNAGCEFGELSPGGKCVPIYSTVCEGDFGVKSTLVSWNDTVQVVSGYCGLNAECTIGYCAKETDSPYLSYLNDWFKAYWLNYFGGPVD